MTEEMLLIEQLRNALNKHINSTNEKQLSYTAIENVKNLIDKFYEDKRKLEDSIKELVDINTNINPYIKKVNECYEKACMLIEQIEKNNIVERLQQVELEIAILKEGDRI